MMTRRVTLALWGLALVGMGGMVSGCASKGKLGEYEFRDRTVSVVALGNPRPQVLTNPELEVNLSNPLQAALRIGADVLKEVEAARARPRLEAAATKADVQGRMMEQVLHGVAAELRAIPVPAADARSAEFEVEVVLKRYGIDADGWLSPAHFFVESEVVLREAATGRRIWKGKVTEREAVTPRLLGMRGTVWAEGEIVNDVITAAGLSSLSSEAMVHALEALADFSGDAVLRKFRRGLEASRR
ncbi:MAG: hypothetical protein EA350_08180 [Gemmatimonadales bacterium]|nr:MAG: hypothetical protein EA350_08180 [Gemmatimonadales bacterium]